MSTAVITPPTTNAGLSPTLAGFAVQAATMAEAMKLCEWLASSTLIPKAYRGNPQAIWTAGAMGAKLGVDLFTSLTGIADINGRPCIWGDLLRGLILNHKDLEGLDERFEGEGDKLTAVCTIKRRGLDAYTARFGVTDAKNAGLLGRDTWKNWTPDMLVNRAFSRAARRRFADVLSGLHSAEEVQDGDVVDVTATATVHDDPKPAKVRREIVKEAKPPSQENEKAPEAKPEPEAKPTQAPAAEQQPQERKPATIADCVAQAERLWKTEDGKRLLKDHLASWKLANVQALGELPPEEVDRYFVKLEEIVATHAKLHGGLK